MTIFISLPLLLQRIKNRSSRAIIFTVFAGLFLLNSQSVFAATEQCLVVHGKVERMQVKTLPDYISSKVLSRYHPVIKSINSQHSHKHFLLFIKRYLVRGKSLRLHDALGISPPATHVAYRSFAYGIHGDRLCSHDQSATVIRLPAEIAFCRFRE